MIAKDSRKIFVQSGVPVGMLGGSDRCRREGDALVLLPDERWGNPQFGNACLEEYDFHIHARMTLDHLVGSGASVLLGGHYHYSHSRPEGNCTFRICLDEDIAPARKSLDKPMHILYGMANPLKRHWNLSENLPAKQVVGKSRDFFTPGVPFVIDLFRRGEDLTCVIDGRDVFCVSLRDDASGISPDRSGDTGWPVSVGFMPGHAPLRIHDFWAEGRSPTPFFPTTDPWLFNSGGYSHYRIPSLCQIPGGRLLAFTEARRARLSRAWEWDYALVKDEVHCVMKSSDDGGRTWSEQTSLFDRGTTYEARDPSALLDRETGELFLFTRGGPWVISSRDQGRTWSAPRSLASAAPGGFKNLTPGTANSAIQLRHGPFPGRLIAALYGENMISVIISDDHGRTWQPGAMSVIANASEPTVMELADGRVIVSPRMMDGNTYGRLFLISHDGGSSFAETRYEPAIPIPGQGELLAVDWLDQTAAGEIRPLVFCGTAANKTRLTLYVSLNDGKTWPISQIIDDGSAANLALVALPSGEVGVLYERDKYRRLSFQRVDLDALIR